ncbi:hypothetical protein L484_009701 [Morus notabilis]|uniref:Uncharacterized protein n=1 Tax=Morus notabilis TaxID=981085 RepID=W9SGE3_9ROSA|nr:hypothetical protein L484_009701 [Morus notabilis]
MLTNQPLKAALSKLDLSGRFTNWAIEQGVYDIKIKPSFVVNQNHGVYDVKDEKIGKYILKVKSIIELFKQFSIEQVSKVQNEKTDDLAKSTTPARGGGAYRVVPIMEIEEPNWKEDKVGRSLHVQQVEKEQS